MVENAAFHRKFQFNYPLLSDSERKIGMAYGACDSPTAANARRISYWIGKDGRIRKAYPKVAAAEHPGEVLAEMVAG